MQGLIRSALNLIGEITQKFSETRFLFDRQFIRAIPNAPDLQPQRAEMMPIVSAERIAALAIDGANHPMLDSLTEEQAHRIFLVLVRPPPAQRENLESLEQAVPPLASFQSPSQPP